MSYFFLFCSFLIGIIFVSSAYSKAVDYGSFKQSLKDYRIIPIYLINFLSLLLVILEVFVSITLLTGQFLLLGTVTGIVLLLIFNFFVSHNLKKENLVSCGCGGILGDSIINKNIIYRNFLLITTLLGINFFSISTYAFNLETIIVFLFTILIVIKYKTFQNILNIIKKYAEFVGG